MERQQAEAERAAKVKMDEKKMRQLQDEAKDKFVNPQVCARARAPHAPRSLPIRDEQPDLHCLSGKPAHALRDSVPSRT